MTDWNEYDGIEDDLEAPTAPSQYHSHDTELLLQRLREVIDSAPNAPLSSSLKVSREELLDFLDEAIVRFPEELRAARWLLKEREEFLAKMTREGDEIMAQARARAEGMVQRTEVVKASEQRAYQILDTAEAEARRLRHEVEDFCDQKLASFEIVLDRTLTMVSSGRAKLQGTNLAADIPMDESPAEAAERLAQGVPRPLPDSLVSMDDGPDFADLPPPPSADMAELFDDEDE